MFLGGFLVGIIANFAQKFSLLVYRQKWGKHNKLRKI